MTENREYSIENDPLFKSISDIKSRVARLDSSSLSSSDYEIRIKELEEATKSMDSFRRQTNQSLIKLRKDLEEFESSKEQDSQ